MEGTVVGRALIVVIGIILGAHLAACTHEERPPHSLSNHTYGSANNQLRVAPASKDDRSDITFEQASQLLNEPTSGPLQVTRRIAFGLARVTITGPFRVGQLAIPVVSPKPNPHVNRLGWVSISRVDTTGAPGCADGSSYYSVRIVDPTTGSETLWYEEGPSVCVVGTSAAPPTVVCGHVLGGSAAGAVVYNVSHRQTPDAYPAPGTIDGLTGGNEVFLRVSDGCVHGADITITPSDAYTVDKTAAALDGKPAAVVLCPSRYVPTTVTATVGGQAVGTASINIPAPPHGFPSCMGRTT
jgi:hypothetical protein